MADINIEATRTRPTACAFYAGRVWYAGVEDSLKSGWILFSQVVTEPSKLAMCYQANDPTSENMSDLLDNDGGVITIPEAGKIVALRPIGSSLLVFATQGVWMIRGSDSGFRATDYSVDLVSNSGCLSPKSIVSIKNGIIYWSNTAIIALAADQLNTTQQQDLSTGRIDAVLDAIPLVCRERVVGMYNETENVVAWAYTDSVDNINTYGESFKNKILKLDLQLQCWYTETYQEDYPFIAGLAVTKESTTTEQQVQVVVENDYVVANGNDVYASTTVANSTAQQWKYITLYEAPNTAYLNMTFSEYDTTRTSFLDWGLNEQAAYVVTGFNFGGNGPVRQKTAPMITVFAKTTETAWDASFLPENQSSIKMQTRWDFTNNSNPGKWSSEYEVYRKVRPYFVETPGAYDDGYPLVITRNMVRGHGRALQIKWAAGTNKDTKLVGWSINFINNNNV